MERTLDFSEEDVVEVHQSEEEIPFEQESNPSDPDPTSDEIPKEQRTLRTQAYDKSVVDLVRMIKDKEIILTPEYQRNYVWDAKKASLLVESILLNIPIPVVYASEDDDGTWNIVDGLQRLNSLDRFFSNKFRLRGLEILQELNGLKYEELNTKARRFLNNGMIRIILIFNDSHPEIKYDIFMRLNTGAVRLKEQELRNCLYRGGFNDLLKELRYNECLMEIIGLKEPHKRMDDTELILRYFAVSDAYDRTTGRLEGYKGKIKTFLNNYMNENKKASTEKLQELRDMFESTIEKAFLVFGDRAFRRINEDGEFDVPINRALMDVIMTSFEAYDKEDLILKQDEILTLLKKLPLEDNEFNEALTWSTSDTKRFEYRLAKWKFEMDAVMGEGHGI